MSFWDSLKPAARAPGLLEATLSDDGRTLSLRWADGAQTSVTAQRLRQECPCAGCVEEWSGRRTLDTTTIPEGMKVLELSAVGNYALTFTFGDLHRTGIYEYTLLRALSTSPGVASAEGTP
jgi:DUF971 family protein